MVGVMSTVFVIVMFDEVLFKLSTFLPRKVRPQFVAVDES